jgi:hypothetical protein
VFPDPGPGPFVWGQIERSKGTYDWSGTDWYVRQAQRTGFATLATIWPFAEWDQALWRQPIPTGRVFQPWISGNRRKPYDMQSYQNFVSALVERYDGDGKDDMLGLKYPIKFWEASNEPDLQDDSFNRFFDGTPDDYAELLRVT